jgi:integrase/recombinase XerD
VCTSGAWSTPTRPTVRCGSIAALPTWYLSPLHLRTARLPSFLAGHCGLRFFYHETLQRDRTTFTIPSPRQPGKLPALLSRDEVQRLIAHAPHLTHRTMLLTTYAAGLRLSEVLHLRVGDIDATRRMIRASRAKGDATATRSFRRRC